MLKGKLALAVVALALMGASASPAFAQGGRLGRVNVEDTKSAVEIKKIFTPVLRAASNSTLVVRVQKDGVLVPVAYGTTITADGYILTKGSEVLGYHMITALVRGQEFQARLVGYDDTVDLAMLKVDAKDLRPVVFARTAPPAVAAVQQPGRGRGGGRDNGGPLPTVAAPWEFPEGTVRVDVGQWIATAFPSGTYDTDVYPTAIGVISTARRSIPRTIGYLGISWLANSYDGSGARIMIIIPNSNAERAGLKADDIVTAVNGTPTPTEADMRRMLQSRSRGDTVTLSVVRDGDKKLTIRALLGAEPDPDLEDQEMMILSGVVNRRSGGFPSVYQHDTVLPPEACGGPLVDLQGNVIGINIARAGRTESYAIPADLVVPLLEPMMSGKMPPPTDVGPQ